jgi:ubiquinone/menaquinone biosynthesis C-methylase UbiE
MSPVTASVELQDAKTPARNSSAGSASAVRLKDFLKTFFGWLLANGQTIRWATQKPVLAKLIDQVPRGATAVDVGCGGGTYAIKLLAPRFERVIAADLVWDHAWLTKQRASRKGLRNFHVVVASADQLPFINGIADLVLCCEVLEHVPNDEAALQEFSRISRGESARLVCSVPHPPEPFDNAEHVRDGYEPADLSMKLGNAGFAIEALRFCMFGMSRKVIRWCSIAKVPLPILFLCQLEHLASQIGIPLHNPYDTIALARTHRDLTPKDARVFDLVNRQGAQD